MTILAAFAILALSIAWTAHTGLRETVELHAHWDALLD